jgi:hypothetical protein
MAKMTEKQGKKVEKVMGEFKRGELKSGSGKKVTDRDQAVAIAMSEANAAKKMAAGGKIDGCAKRGRTKGRMC